MKFFLKSVIYLYRFLLSPVLGSNCRFYPSCSVYGLEAIREHGTLKGLKLIVKRICRCHPWCEGGVDLVPSKEKKEHELR